MVRISSVHRALSSVLTFFIPLGLRAFWAADTLTKANKNTEEPKQLDSRFMELYRKFFDHTGVGVNTTTNNITPKLFHNGCTLWCHDFTPDRYDI